MSSAGEHKQVETVSLMDRINTGLTAWLAVSGVAIYGLLSIAYGIFYGSLSVSPSDVGLSYAKTLTNASATILALIVSLPLVSFIVGSVIHAPWGLRVLTLIFLTGVGLLVMTLPVRLYIVATLPWMIVMLAFVEWYERRLMRRTGHRTRLPPPGELV